MDDPWGSPWADEIQIPSPTKSKGNNVAQTAPPVQAPALILEEKLSSPWDNGDNDDDGFGDWAALPGDTVQKTGLNGAVGGWETQTADPGNMSKARSIDLSPDWDTVEVADISQRSHLEPSRTTIPGEPMRRPSPDPWATDSDIKEELAQVNHEGQQEKHEEPSHTTPFHESEEPEEVRQSIDRNSASSNGTLLAEQVTTDEVTTGDSGQEFLVKDGATDELSVPTPSGETSLGSHESGTISRPSTSPSERSHHDELLQESPRTSFDEEPKPIRPPVPRKVSTKIQGLVEHFDGLAKKEIVEPVITRTSSAQGADRQDIDEADGEDEEDDFGDFEEGQSDDEKSDCEEIPQEILTQDGQASASDLSHQHVPSLESAKTTYGPAEYPFDMTVLETLFPSDIPESSQEKLFIPDSIPFDSFSSTEERRTWYRISRYGTMRKHNTGNDDNYVRANWKQSKIREETLKVVSRWIEEDRIAGRVVLGGASNGASVFSWNDSKAPAVPLSEAFAKHGKSKSVTKVAPADVIPEVPREWPQGLVRDRSTSKSQSPSSKPRRKSSVKATLVSETKTVPTPAANFGWNSTPGSQVPLGSGKRLSEIVSEKGPSSKSTPSHLSRSSVSSLPLTASTSIAMEQVSSLRTEPPLSISKKTTASLPSLATSKIVDDNDDWGEMISSPPTPSLPPPTGLFHKKSHSSEIMAASTSENSNLSGWPSEAATSGHHQTTTRSDETLVPHSMAATSFPQATSNVNIFTAPEDTLTAQVEPSVPAPVPISSDPWATADFSFFDSAPATAFKPVPVPTPKPVAPKTVKFGAPPPDPHRQVRKSKDEMEQDRIVQSVVKGLPDLSYMLKR